MVKRKKRKSSGKPCVGKGGKRVARKKTGRKGCPKGTSPARKTKRKKRK